MDRRSALAVVGSIVGMVGHAHTINAQAQEKFEIPPHDTIIRFRDELGDKDIAIIKMDGQMLLNLGHLSAITISYNGQTKTISPKELFEAL